MKLQDINEMNIGNVMKHLTPDQQLQAIIDASSMLAHNREFKKQGKNLYNILSLAKNIQQSI